MDPRYGLVEMEIKLAVPSSAATVHFYLSNPLPPGTSWHPYDPDSGKR